MIKTVSLKRTFAILLGLSLVLMGTQFVFAGHNGADVDYETIACGETTFTATIIDPDGTHKVSNMYLTVDDGNSVQFENIPTDGGDATITVGPYTQDTTISWNVFGGGERDYDQPAWNGYGDPSFNSDVSAYGAENGWGWILAGTDDPNPFVNWNSFEVEGCVPTPETSDDCKNGGWEAMGFRNQGQCVRYVNTGQDSR